MDIVIYLYIHIISMILGYECIRLFYLQQGFLNQWQENRLCFVLPLVVLGPFALQGISLWIMGFWAWHVATACCGSTFDYLEKMLQNVNSTSRRGL